MEGSILLALQAIRIDGFAQVFALISALGNQGFVWIILGLLFLLFGSRRNVGVQIILAVVLCGIIVDLALGHIFHRPYPSESVAGLVPMMGVIHDGYSFPSFHAASSAAACFIVARNLDSRYVTPALIMGILICAARLYLGVAYPTDVIVGIAAGIGIAFLAEFIYERFLGNMSFGPAPKRKSAKAGKHRMKRGA